MPGNGAQHLPTDIESHMKVAKQFLERNRR